MENYEWFSVPQNIYQGSGSIRAIPEILKKENWKRVLIVCGPTLLKTGVISRFEELLEEAGCEYRIFSDVKPNPATEDVEKIGVPMYREMNADVMLAIGGGSTMDSAKGIAIIGDSDKTIFDIAGVMLKYPPHEPLGWKTYPMIAVPTTCGTGSETTRNAVISLPDDRKLIPVHDCILPAYAVCDPDLLATQPRHVAAASAMDALVQAVEGLVSRSATDFGHMCGLHAASLIGPVIRGYVDDPGNPEYADAMSKGCMYAGICWNNSWPAQNHGCNHPMTELLHISHGDTCAIVMPWFVEYNGEPCRHDFWKVYNYLVPEDRKVHEGNFESKMLVEEFKQLNKYLGISGKKMMLDGGCTEEICRKMAEPFMDMDSYPVPTSKEQMCSAFIDMMNGKYDAD